MAGWSRDKRVRIEKAFYAFLNRCNVNSKDSNEQICLGENLYQGQRDVITQIFDALEDDIHDIYILKSRQLGISTIIRALIIFMIGLHKGIKGALVFDTSDNKAEARVDTKTMIEDLPDSLRFPGIKLKGGDNRQGLTLNNNSKVLFFSAGVRESKSSGGLGRSIGLSLAHCSEMCSWADTEGLESFKQSLSDSNPDRLYIWESTARGYNMWNEMWKDARKDPAHCKCIFLGWWSKDSQRIERDNLKDWPLYGDVYPPSKEELEKIAKVKELYGYDITLEQLAWVRRKYDPAAREEGDAAPKFEANTTRIQEQPWCVVAGTRVGTDLGIIPIEEACFAARCAQGKIVAGGPTGLSKIWRVKTRLGYEFRGTGNHPLISVDAEQIRLDCALGVKVRLQAPFLHEGAEYVISWREGIAESKITITERLARFVGLFMGDGSASAHHKASITEVSICCDAKDTDTIQECADLFLELFGAQANLNAHKGWVTVRTGTKHVLRTIKQMGLLRNDTGKTMRRVHVPEFIWRSPKKVVREFLSGLFEADGFNAYDTNRVALFSKYPEFIADIQLLLLAFGITSRAVSARKKAGDGHFYTGNQLELRTAEALKFNEEIGFISARKRSRHNLAEYEKKWAERIANRASGNRVKPSIVFEDVVISVQEEKVVEQVWNLTVEGSHLFDANGILTHNTEDEAFQQTGAVFFTSEKLKDQSDKYVSPKFECWMFIPGKEFPDMAAIKAENSKSIELKVWEPPQRESVYVVGVDPAFGENEMNDRSSIQVLRCYADGVDQVAEYAWPLVTTKHLAWVVAAIMAWYGNEPLSEVWYILELNGPGNPVLNELKGLKFQIEHGYAPLEEQGLKNIFRNVKSYMYTRPDSLTGGGSAWHWKTSAPLKVMILEQLRGYVANGLLRVRSAALIDEMRTISRDGDTIKAEGTQKDDRVLAMALAVHMWEQRVRKNLIVQRRTRAADEAKRHASVVDQVGMFNASMMESMFKQKASARIMANRMAQHAAWRGRR